MATMRDALTALQAGDLGLAGEPQSNRRARRAAARAGRQPTKTSTAMRKRAAIDTRLREQRRSRA